MTGPPSPSSGPHSGRCPFPDPPRPWRAAHPSSGYDEEVWQQLDSIAASGRFATELSSAFANGRALLDAPDGLRGRTPLDHRMDRRPATPRGRGGTHRPPHRPRLPHQLQVRVRHPGQCLTRPGSSTGLLATSGTWDRTDWYEAVAAGELGSLYRACLDATGLDSLPPTPSQCSREEVGQLRDALGGRTYPDAESRAAYAELCRAVSSASARAGPSSSRPAGSPGRPCCGGSCGSAAPPISSSATTGGTGLPARYRIASPWDWRDQFELSAFAVSPSQAGQPRVDWTCTYRSREDGADRDVTGHVEIRWSHGRFAQPPEAKVYLDTPMSSLPGYHPLDAADQPQLTPVAGRALIPWPDGTAGRTRNGSTGWRASGADVHGEADFVMRRHPSTVLDAGCGTGRVARELARRGVDTVGVDLDRSMIDTARQLAPDLTWLLGDISRLDLHRQFDVVVMAGNVPIFTPDDTQAALVAGCARHVVAGGCLITGFQLDRGYALATYDEHCRQAGLTGGGRWATWSGAPFADGDGYAVSIHERAA